MRPPMILPVLLLAMITSPLVANGAPLPAEPAPLFHEGFDSLDGWHETGGTFTKQCALLDCYAHFVPDCCGTFNTLNKVVGLEADHFTVSVNFRGDSLNAPADTALELDAIDGKNLVLLATDGTGANNGFRLVSGDYILGKSLSDTGVFFQWPLAHKWYRAVIVIDANSGLATASIEDAETGVSLAESSPVHVGDFDSLSIARFRGVGYASSTAGFGWDELTVTT